MLGLPSYSTAIVKSLLIMKSSSHNLLYKGPIVLMCPLVMGPQSPDTCSLLLSAYVYKCSVPWLQSEREEELLFNNSLQEVISRARERERERERASRSSKTDMGVMSEAKSSGKKTMIRVREFGVGRDIRAVEELERRCQAGLSGGDQNPDAAAADNGGTPKKANTRSSKKAKKGMPLYVEQIGDPFSRVRHAPDYVILVI
jgi:hypothetical protein